MAVQFEKPIALGADHGGYELKEAIKQHLEERGIAYRDFGTNSTASCDYPDYAAAACGAVTNGSSDFAILVLRHGCGHVDVCQQDQGHPRLLLLGAVQRRVHPPPQQRQYPVPGRPRCGPRPRLPDR